MVVFLSAAAVDVEAAVVEGLSALLLPFGTVVATEIPRTAQGSVRFPERMVRVTRTGGTIMSPAHDRPTILVECWAARSTDAWQLAAVCRAEMLGWDDRLALADAQGRGGVWLTHRAEGSGPVNYPDPGTAHARYQFLHELQVRAREGA